MAAHSASCAGWVFWTRVRERFFRLPLWLLSARESGLGQPSRALVFRRHQWPQTPHGFGASWFPCRPAEFSCGLSGGCLRAGLSLAMGSHPFPVGSLEPDASLHPAGTPRGEPLRGRGEPQAQDACPASEGWLKGPVVKNIITLSVRSLPTLALPPAAPSLFLISENRLPDKGRDLKLVQRLPNRRGGFNFPLAASQTVRGPLDLRGPEAPGCWKP